MAFDGSREVWDRLAGNRERLRDALRVLESMTPCGNDSDAVQSAKGHLREGLIGLDESMGPQPLR